MEESMEQSNGHYVSGAAVKDELEDGGLGSISGGGWETNERNARVGDKICVGAVLCCAVACLVTVTVVLGLIYRFGSEEERGRNWELT
jgi:hypothetical protein